MKAAVDIQVEPVGSSVSVREAVRDALEVLRESGLETRVHALGTEVVGELEQVLDAIKQIHERLHEAGARKLETHLKLQTRTDKSVDLDEPVEAVSW